MISSYIFSFSQRLFYSTILYSIILCFDLQLATQASRLSAEAQSSALKMLEEFLEVHCWVTVLYMSCYNKHMARFTYYSTYHMASFTYYYMYHMARFTCYYMYHMARFTCYYMYHFPIRTKFATTCAPP